MDFESPDVMKDFPGLYASEIGKKGNNDSDYSDETEKLSKKDLLGKRKDKKDKKDKERGYAALEGESSAEENEARSPSKIKKVKPFKFSTKSKEKREKSREKELHEKKKEKEKKSDKKADKEKVKSDKKERKECGDLAEGLPIFGVNLDTAVERSRCHDGIDLPLPVRACIGYIETVGLTMENVYKVSGTKSKVMQIRKLYNQREEVDLTEYDVPTVTSLLKMYLRDLPEPVFTNDLLIRFEEAGAILNIGTREKHLRTLTENLPANNRILVAWLLIHFDNIILNERQNKMNIQHMAAALSSVLHISNKLFTALLYHCRSLFPTTILEAYVPPLTSTAKFPEALSELETELMKQESLLSQIHSEMNDGFISKNREELLWEVQRITTQLKRKIKNLQKDKEVSIEKVEETVKSKESEIQPAANVDQTIVDTPQMPVEVKPVYVADNSESFTVNTVNDTKIVDSGKIQDEKIVVKPKLENVDDVEKNLDDNIALLQLKRIGLMLLRDKLLKNIDAERKEIKSMKIPINKPVPLPIYNDSSNLDEVMDLLKKENQILQINKINLVRQIMEQEEMCINLKAKIELLNV